MKDYETYCKIKKYSDQEGLKAPQIAEELSIDPRTASKWIEAKGFQPRKSAKRSSKLDPYKPLILQMLEKHPYSATQIFQKIRTEGFSGGFTIVKEYVRKVRPIRKPAFLTLHFEPGECAQVDWGSYGSVSVGSTRRRLSFFVMVLCHSRMLYVEFTLSQTMEFFLSCHKNAFEFMDGVTEKVMVDNLKSAVLKRLLGKDPVLNRRYADFAHHYGFKIVPCAVGKGNEKGRVENGVGYVKKNFLNGLDIPSFTPLNPEARIWMDTIANVREHGETRQQPVVLFEKERSSLSPLPLNPYDVGEYQPVRSTNLFRISLDRNRYSVPAEYASQSLLLKKYPEKIFIYHNNQLIAQHCRSFDRHRNFENPDHVRELLQQRRKARDQKILMRFLTISPKAEAYYQQLEERRLNPRHHVQKIVALREIYGEAKVARAIEDSLEFCAFSCEYIANLLEQRERILEPIGALHLTRREDLLELEIPEPNLSIYEN